MQLSVLLNSIKWNVNQWLYRKIINTYCYDGIYKQVPVFCSIAHLSLGRSEFQTFGITCNF